MKVAHRTITLASRTHGLIVAPDQLVLPVELAATEDTAVAANAALQGLVKTVVDATQAYWEPERQGFRLEKLVGSGVFGGGSSRQFVARRTGAVVVALAEADFAGRMDRAARLLDALAPLESKEVGIGTVSWRHSNQSALRKRVLDGLSEEANAIATRIGLPLAQLRTDGELKVDVLGPMRLRVALPCTMRFGTDAD